MINLLPPIVKEELKREEQSRLLWVLWLLLLSFFLSLSLLFLALRIYLKGSVDAKEILLEAQQQKTSSHAKTRQDIQKLNETIVQVHSFYAGQNKVSDIRERIGASLPQGMHLTLFQYVPPGVVLVKDSQQVIPAKVTLSGFAQSRADLLAFRENLRKEPSFRNFNFPPSNWTKPNDIQFSFSFEIIYE